MSIEISQEETLCSLRNRYISIFVASRFKKHEDAMNTCLKISSYGAKMGLQDQPNEQLKLLHKDGKKIKVIFNYYDNIFKSF